LANVFDANISDPGLTQALRQHYNRERGWQVRAPASD